MLVACSRSRERRAGRIASEAVRGAPLSPASIFAFSPPKSFSVLWALADDETRDVIADCHRQAIEYVISYAEKEVFHSRSGKNGIVEEDITGVIAASFTHFTSRADDPQLHDHVVVWNRGKSVSDGKWRTLDSRAIFKATTTLSELHQGVLSDLLTAALGLGWEARGRRHSAKPRYEITGVAESLMAEFSRRSEQIAEHSARLRAEFNLAHDRMPTAVEDMRLHAVATIATRPDKQRHSLGELTETWRSRAEAHVARDEQLAFVSSLKNRNELPLLHADDLGEAILSDAAEAVVTTVAEHHATYGRQNLLAEAHRILHGVRFASPDDRVAVAEHITELAIARSVCLTPPALHHTPERYIRPDGSSQAQPEEPPRLHDRVPSRCRGTPPRSRPAARWASGEHGRRRRCRPGESSRSRLPTRASTRPMRSRRSPPPGASSICSSARPARASRLPWRDFAPSGNRSTARAR